MERQARLTALLEEVVAAIEAREAADPDLPAWEAEARLRRLEAGLVAEYRELIADRLARASQTVPETRARSDDLRGVF